MKVSKGNYNPWSFGRVNVLITRLYGNPDLCWRHERGGCRLFGLEATNHVFNRPRRAKRKVSAERTSAQRPTVISRVKANDRYIKRKLITEREREFCNVCEKNNDW